MLASPLASGMKLAILRFVPYTQLIDYPEGGDFPAQTHEFALDKLTMEVQQLQDLFTRTPYGPPTSGGSGQDIINEMMEWYQETGQAAGAAAASAAAAATSEQNAANSAAASALSAAQSKADADRAAALVDPAALASSVYNVRKPFVADVAVPSGGVLTLPGYYFPTRDVLDLRYAGLSCVPRKAGVETAGAYQYEEIGANPDVESNQVRVFFDVAVGDVLDMWVVASAAGRNIQEIEALVVLARAAESGAVTAAAEAATSVTEAETQADRAETEADRAETAAAVIPTPVSGTDEGKTLVVRGVAYHLEQPPSPSIAKSQAILSSDLPAGSAYEVPIYVVGANKLNIYCGGLVYASGPDAASDQFYEVGSAGAISTTIKFHDTIPAGAKITAISAT